MIVDIKNSTRDNKRFVVTMDDGKEYHFGWKGAYTYLDGASRKIREAYRARHYGNAIERRLIDNLTPSSALMSWHLIWGPSRDIYKNISYLNKLWREKHAEKK